MPKGLARPDRNRPGGAIRVHNATPNGLDCCPAFGPPARGALTIELRGRMPARGGG